MSKPIKILFIHLGESSFVKEDIKILSEFAELSIFQFNPKTYGFVTRTFLSYLWNWIQQFFWLAKNIRTADAVYCWFSDFHGFLPALFCKWFNKPLYTVLGGFDCNKFPSANYGIFCSPWRAPLGSFQIRNSTLLLPVTETLISTNPISKEWKESHPNGLTENLKNFNIPFIALPTGYDSSYWKLKEGQREKIVTTVVGLTTEKTIYVKGVDLFIECSKLLPDFRFQIIGVHENMKNFIIEKFQPNENLIFQGYVQRDALIEIYNETAVYAQLSRFEGLPNALCESMMCGCVPVGSPVFGIPDAIGETGYIAKKPDHKLISKLIQEAHENSELLRVKARERIEKKFSLDKRRNQLKKLIQNT